MKRSRIGVLGRRGAATGAVALLTLLSVAPCIGQHLKDIHPAGYVSDLAGVVNSDARARLEALCTEVEQKTGAQIAVVTVKSLEGQSVEDYAVDLYKQLGVGKKGDNRGVLLLVAPDEHKYRIEVGYGLEPVINDARAGDAGRAMVPLLRQGNYSDAIETSTWMLAKYIADDRGVTLSGRPPTRSVPRTHDDHISVGFWALLFLVWIIFSIARRAGGPGIRRGGWGGGGWWIGPMLGGMGGGWRGGGFGGSSGGFSGGGGFGGFGGGSSGGGGASGSW